jgi:hypothetical protein
MHEPSLGYQNGSDCRLASPVRGPGASAGRQAPENRSLYPYYYEPWSEAVPPPLMCGYLRVKAGGESIRAAIGRG